MALTSIFFDAGNTIVFPNLARTLASLHAAGLSATREQLHAAERAAKKNRDAQAAAGNARLADQDYWMIFYEALLAALGHRDADLQAALVRETRRAQNWEHLLPGTREVLLAMKQRYRLAVISNSDGHMAEVIQGLGIGECFDTVIDSGIVGHEKPDPRIFQAAMRAIDATPAASMYVGDIYSVDYLGAVNAGMQPMLFDVAGAYRESGLPRVESLEELSRMLMG